MIDNEYIDEEEKEIIESLYSEEWVSDFNDDINKKYQEYARYSIEFNNKIEINLTQRDFNNIQVKAIQAGTTYQSLISMLIHSYNEGKIALTI